MQENPELREGANVVRGSVAFTGVASAFGLRFTLIDTFF
jgi:hypothetical protein